MEFTNTLPRPVPGWNAAAAGCATGLYMGREGGPLGSLQSCALFGVASYFLEGMGKVAPAEAGSAAWARSPDERRLARFWSGRALDEEDDASSVQRLLSPALPLLAALRPCAGGCGPLPWDRRDRLQH